MRRVALGGEESRAKIQQTRQVRLLNLEVVVEAMKQISGVNLRSHRGTGQ